ncbi:uncharacterized protein LOC100679386 [Nasonia vitripennis]|uniref:Myb/SANT-like DNA-binding domain-containing protein n=1 Tax=Nasonia vitripennis TaxID=7425 RepID=A0A7M7GEQ1_NASVI|nr:uncharacterized protein LOC100679386 [Nasonia vitripennis]
MQQSTARRGSSMTSSSGSHVVYHHAKFRWTENLTCRFIQLRKEHGNMFTGRKYSAQAGWEYILRQMREEFPSIMADVHYRVLKKKWSNLLQQYKELKNPVHGDKNKADDISWPFYAAIDEVLGGTSTPSSEPTRQPSDDEEEDEEEELNPQEFLCVSVDNDEDEDDASVNLYQGSTSKVPGLEPLRRGHVFDIERTPRTATRLSSSSSSKMNKRAASDLLSRLPRATELTIRPIRRSSSELPPLEPIATAAANGRSRKRARTALDDQRDDEGSRESKLERKIGEFLEYAKKRDEENRNILLRMLEAVEDIRKAVR